MHLRRACEEVHHFDPSVGSSSGGLDQSEGPPIVIFPGPPYPSSRVSPGHAESTPLIGTHACT